MIERRPHLQQGITVEWSPAMTVGGKRDLRRLHEGTQESALSTCQSQSKALLPSFQTRQNCPAPTVSNSSPFYSTLEGQKPSLAS